MSCKRQQARWSLATLLLFTAAATVMEVVAETTYIYSECAVPYSEGSVSKPCTLCSLCFSKWNADKRSVLEACAEDAYFNAYRRVVKRTTPFIRAAIRVGKGVCTMKVFCKDFEDFKCKFTRSSQDVKEDRVDLISACKCRCDTEHYGQNCNLTVPPDLSIDSFADVQNIVYVPIIYSSDYATIYIYFYTTGLEMNVELETETQNLRYDSGSCDKNVPRLEDLCDTLFRDGGMRDYQTTCKGGPTHDKHAANTACAVAAHIAFSKDKLSDLNSKTFFFDDVDGKKSQSDAKIVAKIEKVKVSVFNRIPNAEDDGKVMSTEFGITVIYRGKSSFESCPLTVTVPQYSKKSENAPSFPRSQAITLTNLVVLEDVPGCENLGEPLTDWFMWIYKVNHDESKDTPFHQMFETPSLTLEPFSLDFGKYQVKSVVRFVTRSFDKGFAYCYFEIIPIPLQPLVFGGSLRYIYYKSNFDLISDVLVDPNYPINDQPKLIRIWSCDDTLDRLCDQISGHDIAVTKYGPFKPEKSYHFTMSVKSPLLPLESCHQTIVISKDIIPNLLIECLRNCGGKGFKSDTREIFYFKVKRSNQSSPEVKENDDYNWTYATDSTTFIDPHDIRQEEETPSWILIVNENSLKDNQEYTFKVNGGGESKGEAQIKVHLFKYAETFQCSINPKVGIAGQTKFSVECNKAEFEHNRHLALNVYFYDKLSENDEFGRLLGTNYMESMDDIVLSRGTVMVSATNMFGQFQQTHVKVSLTFPTLTPEFLNASMITLHRLSENEGYDQKLSYMSSLCDILNKEPSIKEAYVETLLEVLAEEDSVDLVHLELLLSTMEGILCNGNNCTSTKMSDRSYELLSEVLTSASDILIRELQRTARGESHLPTSKVNLLYTSLVKCAGVFLSVQNKDLASNDSMTIDYNVYNLYKMGNMKVLNSMDRVNVALSLTNAPFVKHRAVHTDLVDTWMKDDVPIYFTKGTSGKSSSSYLVMTQTLAKSLSKVSYHIVVYVMTFKNNPYWWSQTEDVSTQVVSISIGYTKDFQSYKPIKLFKHPIDIYLKKNNNQNENVTGFVTQPDSNSEEYNNDLAVSVHQIYVLKGEKISLKFVNLAENAVFRVAVMINRRPDYLMVVSGIEVNHSSPWYHSHRSIKVTEDSDVIFVGILPGPSVPVNETRSYTFELQSARCQVWYDFLWDASGCTLGLNSSQEFLHCQCTHLSSVAGFLGVPINTINPLTDYALFLSVPENPFVLAFILTILLVYVILLVWSFVANKRDMLRTKLLILEDNISSDDCAYLVIVFSGSRLYAGTTSHIGIILHGSQTSSRSHILKSSLRPTLTRDTDDWFLLYTPKSLGIISSVQIWSDHTGTSPNWFCDRIHVHDFTLDKDYSFLIGKWFGVTQMETRVESFARPIKLESGSYTVDFFLTNIVSGFRESHIWVSILAKHPRSPMTRAQRLSIAMVALVTTLLGCILFYDAAMPEDEDLPAYSVSTREALIGFYTMCISIAVTGLVFFAFSKSFTFEHPEAAQIKRSRQSTVTNRVQVDSADTLRQGKRAKRGFKYYIKKVIISLRQEEFYPVQVRTGGQREEQVVVHKVILYSSWILCTCVILVFCFFTVWIGLKIGKNKSLLWLTSICMSLVEDNFVMDPVKIVTIALLLGLAQTQLCDLYAYDPKIFELRKSVVKHVERDHYIHHMRLHTTFYKPPSEERLEALLNQQRLVKKWWTLIDVVDIVFSVIVIFCIIERAMPNDYIQTNSVITNIVFNRINPNKNLTPSPAINNVTRYSMYLQDSLFSSIYCTQWYNRQQLTGQTESLPETGWAKTLTHRMIGVPRLRQIRVDKEACRLPSALNNLSIYCNVQYSASTEDTEYYSAQWNSYTSDYVDVIFQKSPWIYTFPGRASIFGVANTYSETGELFHGAGYIGELTRTRRRSAGTLLNLVDLDWLDMRTRVVFFELSAYNVNNNLFTAITFTVEHLETNLVLASKTVRSVVIELDDALLEVVYFLYSVLVLVKLIMLLNTIGPQVFFTSFWTLYDLCFVLVGIFYFIGYRIVLEMFSNQINAFQRREQEVFFPFAGLFYTQTVDRYMLALLLIFATARSLRLFKYESSIIHIKHGYTLYFSWPQILCVTCVLMFFMFSYQRLIEYLVNCLYPLGTSHWLQNKMNFLDLLSATVSATPNTMFLVYIPCGMSCVALVFYTVLFVESFARANQVYLKTLHDKWF